MNIVKLLAILIGTTAVTLLCIRSGQAMTKTSFDRTTAVYNTPEVIAGHDLGKLFSVTAPTAVFNTSNFTNNGTTIVNETREFPAKAIPSPKVAKELVMKNNTSDELSQVTGRSMNTGMIRENSFAASPAISKNRNPSFVTVRGKLLNPKPAGLSNHRYYDDDDDGNDDDHEVIIDAGVYHSNNRHRYKQINDYSTIDTDIAVAAEDGSTGYHNSYNTGHYKPAGNPNDGSGWNTINQQGNGYSMGSRYPVESSSIGHPPYGAAAPNPVVLMGYRQILRPSNVHYVTPHINYQSTGAEQYNVHSNLQQIQMIYDKVDWHKIGILALFKIGLAKLKAFGFLKILFLLVFKLKLFLIALFFKFLLISKLMKLFKLLLIPLILLTILPIIGSLFSPMLVGGLIQIPMRILNFLTEPVLAPASAATKNSALDSAVSTSTSVSKNEVSSTPYTKRHFKRLNLFDPTLNIFRNVLESEKCVERIACRMAVVEKAGVFPVWINWMLHRVSNFIPNEKLKTYLKSYDDTNNEILSKSFTPDNWSKWCSERYDCNITNLANRTK